MQRCSDPGPASGTSHRAKNLVGGAGRWEAPLLCCQTSRPVGSPAGWTAWPTVLDPMHREVISCHVGLGRGGIGHQGPVLACETNALSNLSIQEPAEVVQGPVRVHRAGWRQHGANL